MIFRSISSIAVIDQNKRLVGNISLTDVQYVARTSSSHLLRATCAHFLSVIKFEQGVRDGQDQVPVFAVYPSTSLASTVAKLVATRAHRMWIVGTEVSGTGNGGGYTCPAPTGFSAPTPPALVPTLPPMQGRLQGVVSLTDILNLFARVGGLTTSATTHARLNRRRSSSSSTATSTSTTDRRR
jgi:CBS domain-containing protein